MALAVELRTPDASLFSGDAAAFIGRSRDGDFTILDQHAEAAGDLVPGVVRIAVEGGERAFLVHGGFFQVHTADGATTVGAMATVAEPVDGIDAARAAAAKERAEAALAGAGDDEERRSSAQAELDRAERRLAAVTH